jgi:hypothetical protein
LPDFFAASSAACVFACASSSLRLISIHSAISRSPSLIRRCFLSALGSAALSRVLAVAEPTDGRGAPATHQRRASSRRASHNSRDKGWSVAFPRNSFSSKPAMRFTCRRSASGVTARAAVAVISRLPVRPDRAAVARSAEEANALAECGCRNGTARGLGQLARFVMRSFPLAELQHAALPRAQNGGKDAPPPDTNGYTSQRQSRETMV